MTKKETFIKLMTDVLDKTDLNKYEEKDVQTAMSYWKSFKASGNKPGMTETGQKIIDYMREEKDNSKNLFKSKTIGEGLFMSARSVSGSMRKLIADGYVKKVQDKPVVYSLTD